MKFSIKRSLFVEDLSIVQRAISSRTTIPVLTGVKILANKEGILLTGSDSTISIEVFIDASDENSQLNIEETGSIVLPARFLSDIVRKLSNDTMTIEVEENLQTKVSSGQAVFTLNGTAGSEYPKLPEIDASSTFSIPGHVLNQVIRHTINAVSTQEIRPIFTGVHVELGDGKLKAVATDSHRLSQRIVPLASPEGQDQTISLNIPGQSLSELSRVTDDNDTVEMMVTDNQVLFKINNIYLYSRLLEGNYPETDRLLPKDYNTLIQIDADDMLAAVERALILSHQGKNNVVKLTMDSEQTVLSGYSPEVGDVKETLPVTKFDGQDLAISFNPDYLREALRTFGSQEVALRFQTAASSFIIMPADQQDNFNFIQLITPIRTPGTR